MRQIGEKVDMESTGSTSGGLTRCRLRVDRHPDEGRLTVRLGSKIFLGPTRIV